MYFAASTDFDSPASRGFTEVKRRMLSLISNCPRKTRDAFFNGFACAQNNSSRGKVPEGILKTGRRKGRDSGARRKVIILQPIPLQRLQQFEQPFVRVRLGQIRVRSGVIGAA